MTRDMTNEKNEILEYIEGADFDNRVCIRQLRALWTAFCIRCDILPDTSTYDNFIDEMWQALAYNETSPWSSMRKEKFEEYMMRDLI